MHTRELRPHAGFAGYGRGKHVIFAWRDRCWSSRTMHAALTLTCSFVTLAMIVGAAIKR